MALLILLLAQFSRLQTWLDESLNEWVNGLWRWENRVGLEKTLNIRRDINFYPQLKKIKDVSNESVCSDTGNVRSEVLSSVGTQKGNRCSNVRPPHSQDSSTCKGSPTLRGSGSFLPTGQSKHLGPTAVSDPSPVSPRPYSSATTLLILSLVVLFLHLIWHALLSGHLNPSPPCFRKRLWVIPLNSNPSSTVH